MAKTFISGWFQPRRRLRDRWGRPVDPGYGVDEGGGPGQGLPGDEWDGDPGYGHEEGGSPDHGFNPDYPSHGFPPGWGRPGGGGHPSQGLPGGRPGGGGSAGQLPIWPMGPEHGLPPVPGHPLPPTDPPPGTIWPPLGEPGQPLPPGLPTSGKVLALVLISGLGYRYVVLDLKPSQGLPAGGRPGQPQPQPNSPQR